ncbi:MAG: HRDC domain-containing protein, partial [Chloroflexi bacterium]|nr:HRDC domain-containing protein [Chloroflexota bacterium]
ALGKIGDPRAVEALMTLLATETKPQVRQYAIKALGKIGDLRAHSILEQIATDSDEQDYNIKAAQLALLNLQKILSKQAQPVASLAPTPPSTSPSTGSGHSSGRGLHSSSPAPPAPSLDTIVLEAVAKLGGTLGRTGLAQFLAGSKAAWLETLAQHSRYGQLAPLSQQAVIDIIDALITDGRLATTGGNRPKVVLVGSEQAKAALREPKAPCGQAQEPAGVKKEGQAGETIGSNAVHQSPPSVSDEAIISASVQAEPDPVLLEALRAWRTQQAKSQGIPPYIVFSNKVLEAIAAWCPSTVAELGEISGVGPAKLEQYGADVIVLLGKTLSGGETQGVVRERPEPIQGNGEEIAESLNSQEANTNNLVNGPTTRNTPAKQIVNRKSKIVNPLESILTVVSDLDGLLSPQSLAQLLTAAPGEVVPFSDHELCGIFHGILNLEAVETHIQEAIQTKHLVLTPRQRLTKPIDPQSER